GTASTSLGTFTGPQTRSRTCNTQTGCTDWSTTSHGGVGDVALFIYNTSVLLTMYPGGPGSVNCGAVGSAMTCESGWNGVLTNHCFRVAASTQGVPSASG